MVSELFEAGRVSILEFEFLFFAVLQKLEMHYFGDAYIFLRII